MSLSGVPNDKPRFGVDLLNQELATRQQGLNIPDPAT